MTQQHTNWEDDTGWPVQQQFAYTPQAAPYVEPQTDWYTDPTPAVGLTRPHDIDPALKSRLGSILTLGLDVFKYVAALFYVIAFLVAYRSAKSLGVTLADTGFDLGGVVMLVLLIAGLSLMLAAAFVLPYVIVGALVGPPAAGRWRRRSTGRTAARWIFGVLLGVVVLGAIGVALADWQSSWLGSHGSVWRSIRDTAREVRPYLLNPFTGMAAIGVFSALVGLKRTLLAATAILLMGAVIAGTGYEFYRQANTVGPQARTVARGVTTAADCDGASDADRCRSDLSRAKSSNGLLDGFYESKRGIVTLDSGARTCAVRVTPTVYFQIGAAGQTPALSLLQPTSFTETNC